MAHQPAADSVARGRRKSRQIHARQQSNIARQEGLRCATHHAYSSSKRGPLKTHMVAHTCITRTSPLAFGLPHLSDLTTKHPSRLRERYEHTHTR